MASASVDNVNTSLPPHVIRKACPDDVPNDGLIIITGRQASGKTFMANWLLAAKGHKYHSGMFISNDYHTILEWKNHINNSCIFRECDLNEVEEWVKAVTFNNMQRVEQDLPMRQYLLVLDDIGYVVNSPSSKLLSRLAVSSKRIGIAVWIITQNLYHLTQQIREAADFVICFRENNAKQLKKIKDDVFFALGKDFDAVYKTVTGRSRPPTFGEEQDEYNRACPPRALCMNYRGAYMMDDWRDGVLYMCANYWEVESPWVIPMCHPFRFEDAPRTPSTEDTPDCLGVPENVFILEEDYVKQVDEAATNPPSTVNGE